MLFCNTLFLSILFTSVHTVSAVNVGSFLAVRQTSACDSQCATASKVASDGNCSIACICTPATINNINQCVQCAEAANITTGLNSGYLQRIEADCANAGYPVSVGSSSTAGSTPSGTGSGSGGGTTASPTTTGSTPSGTGLGSGGGATSPATTTTGGLGGSSTTTAVGGQSTTTGTTPGKSSATGLTPRLGEVVAAAVGIFILAA